MHVGLITKDFAVGRAFNSNGLPSKSGAEFHAENHARELMRLGHRVTIFAKKRYFATKAREDVNGIDLVRLHEPSRGAELLLRLRTTHRDVDHRDSRVCRLGDLACTEKGDSRDACTHGKDGNF